MRILSLVALFLFVSCGASNNYVKPGEDQPQPEKSLYHSVSKNNPGLCIQEMLTTEEVKSNQTAGACPQVLNVAGYSSQQSLTCRVRVKKHYSTRVYYSHATKNGAAYKFSIPKKEQGKFCKKLQKDLRAAARK